MMQYAELVLWGYTSTVMKATFPYKFNKLASDIKISATGANTVSRGCMSHPHGMHGCTVVLTILH